jgi:hypothetical protein
MKSTHELIDAFCAIDLSDLNEKQINDHVDRLFGNLSNEGFVVVAAEI